MQKLSDLAPPAANHNARDFQKKKLHFSIGIFIHFPLYNWLIAINMILYN